MTAPSGPSATKVAETAAQLAAMLRERAAAENSRAERIRTEADTAYEAALELASELEGAAFDIQFAADEIERQAAEAAAAFEKLAKLEQPEL